MVKVDHDCIHRVSGESDRNERSGGIRRSAWKLRYQMPKVLTSPAHTRLRRHMFVIEYQHHKRISILLSGFDFILPLYKPNIPSIPSQRTYYNCSRNHIRKFKTYIHPYAPPSFPTLPYEYTVSHFILYQHYRCFCFAVSIHIQGCGGCG